MGITRFNWFGRHVITGLEAWDQSNGEGGEVYYVQGGVGHTNVTLYMASVWEANEIDFIINVYGEISSNVAQIAIE